jgi:hypothetical protein
MSYFNGLQQVFLPTSRLPETRGLAGGRLSFDEISS